MLILVFRPNVSSLSKSGVQCHRMEEVRIVFSGTNSKGDVAVLYVLLFAGVNSFHACVDERTPELNPTQPCAGRNR